MELAWLKDIHKFETNRFVALSVVSTIHKLPQYAWVSVRVCWCMFIGFIGCCLHNMRIFNCYYRCTGACPLWPKGATTSWPASVVLTCWFYICMYLWVLLCISVRVCVSAWHLQLLIWPGYCHTA